MTHWSALALCAEADPEAWYPEVGEAAAAVKRICARCPVRLPCLEDALASSERWGIRGGLSYNERRRLKRERAA